MKKLNSNLIMTGNRTRGGQQQPQPQQQQQGPRLVGSGGSLDGNGSAVVDLSSSRRNGVGGSGGLVGDGLSTSSTLSANLGSTETDGQEDSCSSAGNESCCNDSMGSGGGEQRSPSPSIEMGEMAMIRTMAPDSGGLGGNDNPAADLKRKLSSISSSLETKNHNNNNLNNGNGLYHHHHHHHQGPQGQAGGPKASAAAAVFRRSLPAAHQHHSSYLPDYSLDGGNLADDDSVNSFKVSQGGHSNGERRFANHGEALILSAFIIYSFLYVCIIYFIIYIYFKT